MEESKKQKKTFLLESMKKGMEKEKCFYIASINSRTVQQASWSASNSMKSQSMSKQYLVLYLPLHYSAFM